MAADIEAQFGLQPTLIKSRGGVFEVSLDGELLFSKKEAGRFPSTAEVADLLAARLPPAG
ncbi:MAG: Rdx family protein [Thermoanaerobaculia bacterium]|nr:Rdx family protein [Thermoanaerobaculia bacterium]MBP9826519.1 Rdx family protein [Thermoanaerobaculia bacterium]